MIAKTIEEAPRSPAKEIRRLCPLLARNGRSRSFTASGRAIRVRKRNTETADIKTPGSSEGVASRPSRKKTAICMRPVRPSKKWTMFFLPPIFTFPSMMPVR